MIETERLELISLTLEQLKLWAFCMTALECELACSYQAEPMEGLFLDIVKGQIEKTEQDPHNYMWHSFWLLIRKSDRVVVGSSDFKGVPNENNEVEIGYGLGKQHEHNGYMTEAVKAMCDWAFMQDGVASVIAETDLDGFASQRVLARCGFRNYQCGDTLWWKL